MPVNMGLLPGERPIGLYHEVGDGSPKWGKTMKGERAFPLEGKLCLEILIGLTTHTDIQEALFIPTIVAYLSACLYNA